MRFREHCSEGMRHPDAKAAVMQEFKNGKAILNRLLKKGDAALSQCSLLDVSRLRGRNRRTLRFTPKGPLAELEKTICKYIQDLQRRRRPLRLGLVVAKAKQLVNHLDEAGQTLLIRDRPFKVSDTWGRRFLARQGLCYRKIKNRRRASAVAVEKAMTPFISMLILNTNTRWRPWALCRDSF